MAPASLPSSRWPEWFPDRSVTSLYGFAAGAEIPVFMRPLVYRAFGKAVGVNFDEVEKELSSYPTLNAFFVRKLKEGLRPRQVSGDAWAVPADGRIDQGGVVRDGALVQAKGIDYDVLSFLDDRTALEHFDGGLFATVYLSPKDYHRVHAPVDMVVHEIVHLGGRLLPVNGLTVPSRADTFVDNERVVLRFTDGAGKQGALVMVAALGVGGIALETDKVTLRMDHSTVRDRHLLEEPWQVSAHQEVGRFLLGSTVVLLREAQEGWSVRQTGTPVRLGEPLFGP